MYRAQIVSPHGKMIDTVHATDMQSLVNGMKIVAFGSSI